MTERANWTGETLKTLRLHWLTADEFATANGWVSNVQRCRMDLDALEKQGIVIKRRRENAAAKRRPAEYTLAPDWGGQAA